MFILYLVGCVCFLIVGIRLVFTGYRALDRSVDAGLVFLMAGLYAVDRAVYWLGRGL